MLQQLNQQSRLSSRDMVTQICTIFLLSCYLQYYKGGGSYEPSYLTHSTYVSLNFIH